MKIGAQLFTVRMFTQTVDDFRETIRRVAEMGYRYVQISGAGNAVTPEKARKICDEFYVFINAQSFNQIAFLKNITYFFSSYFGFFFNRKLINLNVIKEIFAMTLT